MNTKLSDEQILQEYDQADDAGKLFLERHYGKETFVKKDDYTSLKTISDCLNKIDAAEDYNNVKIELPGKLGKYKEALLGTLDCFIARDAIADNEEVEANGKRRYFPYFYNKAGVGFVFFDSRSDGGLSFLCSRLEFYEKEKSDYFGQQFLPIHKRRLGF